MLCGCYVQLDCVFILDYFFASVCDIVGYYRNSNVKCNERSSIAILIVILALLFAFTFLWNLRNINAIIIIL